MLLSSFPLTTQVISTAFIAHGVVFVALAKTLSLSATAQPRRKTFDVGFLLSVAALCYWPAVVFIPFFIFFFRTVRAVRWQEMSAYLLGVITPLYLYAGYAVAQGNTQHVLPALKHLWHWPPQVMTRWPLIAMGAFYGIIWVYSLMRRQAPQWQPTAAAKKKWQVLSLFMLPALLAALATPHTPGLAWGFVVSPFSIILSVCFLHYKEKYNTFAFYCILAAILGMVWLF